MSFRPREQRSTKSLAPCEACFAPVQPQLAPMQEALSQTLWFATLSHNNLGPYLLFKAGFAHPEFEER